MCRVAKHRFWTDSSRKYFAITQVVWNSHLLLLVAIFWWFHMCYRVKIVNKCSPCVFNHTISSKICALRDVHRTTNILYLPSMNSPLESKLLEIFQRQQSLANNVSVKISKQLYLLLGWFQLTIGNIYANTMAEFYQNSAGSEFFHWNALYVTCNASKLPLLIPYWSYRARLRNYRAPNIATSILLQQNTFLAILYLSKEFKQRGF